MDMLNMNWFREQEEKDHLRMTWNPLPSSNLSFKDCNPFLPVSALYGPIPPNAILPNELKSYREYLVCPFEAFFNAYCSYNEHCKCNICSRSNRFPPPPYNLVHQLNSIKEYQLGEN